MAEIIAAKGFSVSQLGQGGIVVISSQVTTPENALITQDDEVLITQSEEILIANP